MQSDLIATLQRRHFLRDSGLGLGMLALSQLAGKRVFAGDSPKRQPLAPRSAQFAPQAKRVIFLFMAGAPSQLDLFEPKPKMKSLHRRPVPDSFLENLDDVLIKGSAQIWASPRKFTQHGEAGMYFSDYLPHLATCADELCMIRSMNTSVSNHHPGQLLMNCGVPHFGLPSMGSWVTYGLGTESSNMPGFVVMLSRNGSGDLGGPALWGNAFLPAIYRGLTFRSQGDPILHLGNPQGVSNPVQRQRLQAVLRLNELRQQQHPDPAIASRIAAYEMAFRMQTACPELANLANESKQTLEDYGIHDPKSQTFGTNCLLARRMIERDVRFVQLYHYTWDDHAGLDKKLKANCEATERGVAALIKDLRNRGLLDDTLVVWGGEFGRTPMNEVRRGINPGNEGRDHHPFAFTMLMAGGGVKPGYIHGETDEIGYHAIRDRVHVHDLQATMLHCLGLNHEDLTYHFQGRDQRLTDVAGNVIHDILL